MGKYAEEYFRALMEGQSGDEARRRAAIASPETVQRREDPRIAEGLSSGRITERDGRYYVTPGSTYDTTSYALQKSRDMGADEGLETYRSALNSIMEEEERKKRLQNSIDRQNRAYSAARGIAGTAGAATGTLIEIIGRTNRKNADNYEEHKSAQDRRKAAHKVLYKQYRAQGMSIAEAYDRSMAEINASGEYEVPQLTYSDEYQKKVDTAADKANDVITSAFGSVPMAADRYWVDVAKGAYSPIQMMKNLAAQRIGATKEDMIRDAKIIPNLVSDADRISDTARRIWGKEAEPMSTSQKIVRTAALALDAGTSFVNDLRPHIIENAAGMIAGNILEKKGISTEEAENRLINGTVNTALNEEEQRLIREAQAQGKPAELVTNTFGVVGRMLPTIITNIATGDPEIGLTVMAAGAAGDASVDAYNRGYDIKTANRIGIEKGIIEYLSEKTFAGAESGGESYGLSKALRELLGRYAYSKPARAVRKIFDVAGENVEEMEADILDPAIEWVNTGTVYTEDAKTTIKEAIMNQLPVNGDGLTTLLSSLMLSGISSMMNSVVTVPQAQAEEIATIAKQSGNEKLEKLADTYLAMLSEGKQITAAEFQRLQEETEGRMNFAEPGSYEKAVRDYEAELAAKQLEEVRNRLDAMAGETTTEEAREKFRNDNGISEDAARVSFTADQLKFRQGDRTGSIGSFRADESGNLYAEVRYDDGEMSEVAADSIQETLPEGMKRLITLAKGSGENAAAVINHYAPGQDVEDYVMAAQRAIDVYAKNGATEGSMSADPVIKGILNDQQIAFFDAFGEALADEVTKTRTEYYTQIRQKADAIEKDQRIVKSNLELADQLTQYQEVSDAMGEYITETMKEVDSLRTVMKNAGEGTEDYNAAKAKAGTLTGYIRNTVAEKREYDAKITELKGGMVIRRKNGTVRVYTPNSFNLTAPDMENLTNAQKEKIRAAEAVADALPVDVVLFAMEPGQDMETSYNSHGFFSPSEGAIYMNINGNASVFFGNTLSHELTHWMQRYAPEEYLQLKSFIRQEYARNGQDFDAAAKEYAKTHSGENAKVQISVKASEDELVAQACADMLENSKTVERLARENYSLAKKIRDHLTDVIGKIKAVFRERDKSRSAELPRSTFRLDKIQEIWDTALEKAAENAANERFVRDYEAKAKDMKPEPRQITAKAENKNAAEDGDVKMQAWSTQDINRNYIDYTDRKKINSSVKSKIQSLIERGKNVILPKSLIAELGNAVNWNNKNDRFTIVKDLLAATFGNDSVVFNYDGGFLEAHLSGRAYDHIKYGFDSPEKAALLYKGIELVSASEYVFSSKNNIHSENSKKANADWDYFVSVGKYENTYLPVLFSIRTIESDVRSQIYNIANIISENKMSAATSEDGTYSRNAHSAYGASTLTADSITDADSESNAEIQKKAYEDEEVSRWINESMTMREAETMINKAYAEANPNEWYGERRYRNASEWLNDVEDDEVAMYIENTYNLQRKYINSNEHIVNDDFSIEDVIRAYRNGTLIGKEKPKAKRIDISNGSGYEDSRFYAPKTVSVDVKTYDLANTRVTNSNRAEVYKARKDILFAAHSGDLHKTLGITASELNKKLKSWSNYSVQTREISQRINANAAPENQWTGIQNSSVLSDISITDDDIRSMVKEITGTSSEYERKYIGQAMLALDTHIDWSGLTFNFVKGSVDPNRRSVRGKYEDRTRTISVGSNKGGNTVAHEMGHALDYRWERDLFGEKANLGLSQNPYVTSLLKTEEEKQFYNNFKLFMDSITDVNDSYNSYTNEPSEVFARFVAKFVEWTRNVAGQRIYSEGLSYNDRFTQAQFVEFARLLQEKASIDSRKAAGGSEGVQFRGFEQETDELTPEESEKRINELRAEINDAEEQQTFAEGKELTDISNRLTRLYYELDRLTGAEQKAAVKTSLREIEQNLENYRRSDLESLAEQLSDGAWDGYEELTREELADGIRGILNERMGDMHIIDTQNRKYGLYVRPPMKTVQLSAYESEMLADIEEYYGQISLWGEETEENTSALDEDLYRRMLDGSLHPQNARDMQRERDLALDLKYFFDNDRISDEDVDDMVGLTEWADKDRYELISALYDEYAIWGADMERTFRLMEKLVLDPETNESDMRQWISGNLAPDFAAWYAERHPVTPYPYYNGKDTSLPDSSHILTYNAEDIFPGAQFQMFEGKDIEESEAIDKERAKISVNAQSMALRETIDAVNDAIENVKGEFRISETPAVREEDARKLARKHLKEWSSRADREAVTERLAEIGAMAAEKMIDADAIKEKARDLAGYIVSTSEETDESYDSELYHKIRDVLRSGIRIDERHRPTDFNEWRKANFGKIIVKNDGISVEEAYGAIRDVLGAGQNILPEDIAEGDMLDRMLELLDTFGPKLSNRYEGQIGEAAEYLANEIVREAVEEKAMRIRQTLADRFGTKIVSAARGTLKTLTEAQNALAEEGAAAAERLENSAAEMRDAIGKAVAEERARGNRKAENEAKKAEEIRNRLEAAMERLDAQKKDASERIRQVREEEKAKREAAVARERAKKWEKVKGVSDFYRNREKEANSKRKEAASIVKYRRSVDRRAGQLYEWLMKNSQKEHVPESMKEPISRFLEALDFSSRSKLNGKRNTKNDLKFASRAEALRRLIDAQLKYQNGIEGVLGLSERYIDLPDGIVETLDKLASEATERMELGGETLTINNMNGSQLKDLDNILKAVGKAVRTMNDLAYRGRYAGIDEVARETFDELERMPEISEKLVRNGDGKNIRAALNGFFAWDEMVPVYAFGQMGDGASAMFDGIRKGWGQMARNMMTVKNFAEETWTPEQAKAWTKEEHTFTLESGETVKMTADQIMSFYCLAKRNQALQHMRGGGIRAGKSTAHHRLTENDIIMIASSLTPEQTAVADRIQRFLNGTVSLWGNEVSMARFGIRQFTEENYFPIETDDTDRNAIDPQTKKNDMFRLLNAGFTKSLNPNANNTLVVSSIFDVFANHASDMAKLNGIGLPMLDMIKWFNFREREETDDGQKIIKRSVQREIERVYGKDANGYITNFIRDLNGVREGGRGEGMLSAFVSSYKVAQVGANLRVVIQQPTSIARAAMEISPRYLMAARGGKNAYNEMMGNSGLALWKIGLGFYDINVNRGMREMAKNSATKIEELREKSTDLAGKADEVTWEKMWSACKMEQEELGKTGRELLDATTERFENLMLKTQVIDSTISRSQLMRSNSLAVSEYTGFMSEPTMSYNMMANAYLNFRRAWKNSSFGEAMKNTGGKLTKSVAVFAGSAFLTALAAAISDAARDDDDYASWLEKYLNAVKSNFADNIDPTQLVPIVRDIAGELEYALTGEGYADSGSMVTAGMDRAIDFLKLIVNGQGNYTDWGVVYKGMQAVGMLIGLPIAPAAREITSMYNNAATIYNDIRGDEYGEKLPMIHTYAKKPVSRIREAYDSGYITEEQAQQELISQGAAADETAAAKKVYGWGLDDGETAYDRLLNAVRTGDSYTARQTMSEMYAAGYTEKTVTEKIRDNVKAWYLNPGTDFDRNAAERALTEYAGMDSMEAEDKLSYWAFIEENPQANADGKGSSPTQDELGSYLYQMYSSGMISYSDACRIWNGCNPTWKTTFDGWVYKNR